MAGPGRAGGRGQTFIPARAVKGDLTVSYRAPVVNGNNGGTTPINPRIDGQGFSALGMTLLVMFVACFALFRREENRA